MLLSLIRRTETLRAHGLNTWIVGEADVGIQRNKTSRTPPTYVLLIARKALKTRHTFDQPDDAHVDHMILALTDYSHHVAHAQVHILRIARTQDDRIRFGKD